MADDEREADPVLEPSDEGEFTLGFKDGPGGIVVCARTGNFVRAVIYGDGVRNVCHFVDNGVIKNGTWVPIEPSWAAPEPRPMTDDEREQARRNAAKACELHWWQDKPGDIVTKLDYTPTSDPYGEAAKACAGWAERYAAWLRDRIANAPDGRTPPPEPPAPPVVMGSGAVATVTVGGMQDATGKLVSPGPGYTAGLPAPDDKPESWRDRQPLL